ncbi:MAG: hypothetical protein R3268_13810 [Acidiferrobacterales bacterium]|nr:hypothetical protein [Acidiferrobacterales bacterium]
MRFSRDYHMLVDSYLPEDFSLTKAARRMQRQILAETAGLDEVIVQWRLEEEVEDDVGLLLGLSRVGRMDTFLLFLRHGNEVEDLACWVEMRSEEHD